MRRPLLSLLFLCGFSGGGFGGFGACAHVGGAFSHVHVPSGGLHFSPPAHASGPVFAPPVHAAPGGVLASAGSSAATVRFAVGGYHLRQAVAVAIDGAEIGAEAASDMVQLTEVVAPDADLAPPSYGGKCRSFADCGDGTLGQGVVCDRTARALDPNAVGVCRDACRTTLDCPAPLQCHAGIDPADPSWAGCVP
jgi:hypothetical protein